MVRRVLAVCLTTARRESQRLDLAMTRLVFLGVAFGVLIPTAVSVSRSPRTGALLFPVQFGLSVVLLVFLAVRLSGDSVGDRSSGLSVLLCLSEIRPIHWLAIRTLQMWMGFLSVWCVRAPLLAFIFCMGGLSQGHMLTAELLLLSAFLAISSLGLFVADTARSRQQVTQRTMLCLVLFEMLLLLPWTVTGPIAGLLGWSFPTRLQDLSETIAGFGLGPRYRSVMSGLARFDEIWTTILVYGGLTLLVMWRYCMAIHANLGEQAAPADTISGSVETLGGHDRVRRRCWDDALAWQAYAVHGGGSKALALKCLGYMALGIVCVALQGTGYGELGIVLPILISTAMLLMSAGKAGDCLQREIREKTLPTLLLLPNESVDFYDGWRRGAWYLSWPDLILFFVAAFSARALTPEATPVVLAFGISILMGGPFLMLSPLIPFSFYGIVTGVFVLVGLLFIVGLSVALAVEATPAVMPLVMPLMVFVYNRVLRRWMVPWWFREKVSTQV